MSELWDKWKYRLIFGACAWVLLAFIFSMQRYGWSIFSPSILWEKLGNLILLRWLNSTLITGLMAIAAAMIGGYFLFKNSNIKYHREKVAYIKLITMHSTTITHELNNNVVIDKLFLNKLINSAEKLSHVDTALMWLSMCTSKHLKFYLDDENNEQKRNYAFTMLVCLNMTLLDAMKRLEHFKHYKLDHHDEIFDEIKSHINDPKNMFSCKDMGEFQIYMDKRNDLPAASAPHLPKS